MTITQLQYIIAVDQHKSFVKAAEHCHVTQSTLSMQIKKLEESLGILIFDRTKKPVQLTFIGEQIIKQAAVGLSELERIKTIIQLGQDDLAEELRIGVIPTLAPYLIPLFLVDFVRNYPSVNIITEELQTEDIIIKLYNNQLDVGLLVTPLKSANLIEIPLFYEPFVGYISESHPLYHKKYLQAEDLGKEGLWLLEKGHCFRGQALSICQDQSQRIEDGEVYFECGSLETLRRIIDRHHGYTLLPELATLDFGAEQRAKVRVFEPPVPVREVGLVIHQSYIKRSTIELFKREIQSRVPPHLLAGTSEERTVLENHMI